MYTCAHYTYMYTYVHVHLHIIPPISPPQDRYRSIMGLQNHIAVLLANPTEVRRGAGDDNL